MSVSQKKYELNVLIRQKTRLKLSLLFKEKFQNKYPSFSQWVEDLLITGIDAMEDV
jgi:hypothetical protein